MAIIALDIGGTKIASAIIKNNTLKKVFIEPVKLKKEKFLSHIFSCINRLHNRQVSAICISMPGVIKKSILTAKVGNLPFLHKIPLKAVLEKKFKIPVSIENDANCFIRGEKRYGQATKENNVAGVIIGTGFGLGLILWNKLIKGKQTKSGEFGSLNFKNKTIEDYCSGKFFENEKGVNGKILSMRARKGDPSAQHIFEEYGTNLGKAVQILIDRYPVNMIIFGGSVVNDFSFFEESMRKQIKKKIIIKQWSKKHIALLGAAQLIE